MAQSHALLRVTLVLVVLSSMAVAMPVQLQDVEMLAETEEDGAWGSLYFDAMEEDHQDRDAKRARLGEGNAATRNIRDPPKVKNKYGKMVDNMKKLKSGYKSLNKQNRMYHKLQHYGASTRESEAVNNVIATSQALAAQKTPNIKANAKANAANEGLMNAEVKREKAEKIGSKMHGVNKPIPDHGLANEKSGPFGKLYVMSRKLYKDEEVARRIALAARAKGVSKKVKKLLHPGKKGRKHLRKQKRAEDIYHNYEVSKVDMNPKHSKYQKRTYERTKAKLDIIAKLKAAASKYRLLKRENPKMRYESMVAGTPIEGIKNVYILDLKKESAKLKSQSARMYTKEKKLTKDRAKYIREHTLAEHVVSLKKMQKQDAIDRQTKKLVLDPGATPPAIIKADEKKMEKRRFHASIGADLMKLKLARKQAQAIRDQQTARVESRAPTKADMKALEKQGILGAKQLETDQKVALKRLKKKTLRVGKKKFIPSKNPNWKKIERRTNRRQKRELTKIAQKAVAKDAAQLAKTGSRTDLRVLRSDTKAAEKGGLTVSPAEKALIVQQEKFYNKIRRNKDPGSVYKGGREGNKLSLKDIKVGIKARVKREMKQWNKVKKFVTKAVVPKSYGASALNALPSSSKSPLLNGDLAKVNFSGNSNAAMVPLNKDNPPNPGTSKVSQGVKDEAKISVYQAKAEKKARPGFGPTPNNTPNRDIKKAKVESKMALSKVTSSGANKVNNDNKAKANNKRL